MVIKKFIKVNGVEVSQNSCMVDFNVISDLSMMQPIEMTHVKLYELLDTASEVKEVNEDNNTKFCKFRQGIVWYTAYKKNKK